MRRFFRRDMDWYESVLADQGGVCAICGEVCKTGKALAVDHDRTCCDEQRTCGECVRGLLCSRCNQAIGLLQEAPELMEAAAAYVRKFRATAP
ncbi:MAG: endonuclease VII domain-containing protein [Actinobacteria bacterium]|nr:endonuclease VII domain-containing protein [Actinomycetota bacterium]